MSKLRRVDENFLKNVLDLCDKINGFCDRNVSCTECIFYGLGIEDERDDSLPCMIYLISSFGTEVEMILEEENGEEEDDD